MQSMTQQHGKTTMQYTNMIDHFRTSECPLGVDVIPLGTFHNEDEFQASKKSALFLPVDVLQKVVRDDDVAMRMAELFLKTPEGTNLQNQFEGGLLDEVEYRVCFNKLFGSFIDDLNTKRACKRFSAGE